MRNNHYQLTDKHLSSITMKGATTGMLIGARFGPKGIIIGACIGGVIGFVIDHQTNSL